MQEKLKIVYVSGSAQFGGMEQHLLDLVNGLTGKFEITIVCPNGPMVKEYQKANAKVIIDYPLLDIDPLFIARLYKYFKQIKPQILHTHQLKSGVNALIAGFLANIKIKVSHVHTPISMWKINKVKRYLDIKIYSAVVNLLANYEIALTESIKKQKISEGVKRNKLYVIPNGVDYSRFDKVHDSEKIRRTYGIKQSTFLVGAVGVRLSQEKDHKNLLKALYEVDKKIHDWHLIIGGSGPLEEELIGLASKLGLNGKVNFLGRFVEKEKPLLLSSLDLFVFPTLAEGFGIVLLEAMAAGLSCIAADLEVLKEIGGNAVSYYKTSDYKDLARKILELYSDSELRERIASSAEKRVKENYTLERFWENYSNLYKQLLS